MSISEREIINLLSPYVRSVFGAKKERTPEFVGSGILLSSQDNLYLVTAAHVMDRFDENQYPLFLDGIDGLVGISGKEICSYTTAPGDRGDDKHDISIVKLMNKKEHLDPACFVGLEQMDCSGEHDPQLGYFCVGIPVKKGDKSIYANNMIITPEPYGLRANESSDEIYGKLSVERKTHLALSFNLKLVYSQDGQKRTAPALNGLSGAPIWGFVKKNDSELRAVIVAILTEHHQRDIKAILSTRVSEIFRDILL